MMIQIGWDARSNAGLKTFANRKRKSFVRCSRSWKSLLTRVGPMDRLRQEHRDLSHLQSSISLKAARQKGTKLLSRDAASDALLHPVRV